MSFMREILSKLPPDLLRYCNTETTWLGKEVKQYANLAEIPPLREDPVRAPNRIHSSCCASNHE